MTTRDSTFEDVWGWLEEHAVACRTCRWAVRDYLRGKLDEKSLPVHCCKSGRAIAVQAMRKLDARLADDDRLLELGNFLNAARLRLSEAVTARARG